MLVRVIFFVKYPPTSIMTVVQNEFDIVPQQRKGVKMILPPLSKKIGVQVGLEPIPNLLVAYMAWSVKVIHSPVRG